MTQCYLKPFSGNCFAIYELGDVFHLILVTNNHIHIMVVTLLDIFKVNAHRATFGSPAFNIEINNAQCRLKFSLGRIEAAILD